MACSKITINRVVYILLYAVLADVTSLCGALGPGGFFWGEGTVTYNSHPPVRVEFFQGGFVQPFAAGPYHK